MDFLQPFEVISPIFPEYIEGLGGTVEVIKYRFDGFFGGFVEPTEDRD